MTRQKPLKKILSLIILFLTVFVCYRFWTSDDSAYSRGLNEMQAKQYDAAIRDFSRALRQNSADSSARLGLATAYQAKGWFNQATQQYETAAKAAADTVYLANLNLGLMYADRNQGDLALQQFLKLMKIDPQNANGPLNAGLAAERIGRKDDAKKLFQNALAIDPNLAKAKEHLRLLGNHTN